MNAKDPPKDNHQKMVNYCQKMVNALQQDRDHVEAVTQKQRKKKSDDNMTTHLVVKSIPKIN